MSDGEGGGNKLDRNFRSREFSRFQHLSSNVHVFIYREFSRFQHGSHYIYADICHTHKHFIELYSCLNLHISFICVWDIFTLMTANVLGFRASQENSRGTSFGTISAFGSNGAIIHYSPTPETDARITRYLCTRYFAPELDAPISPETGCSWWTLEDSIWTERQMWRERSTTEPQLRRWLSATQMSCRCFLHHFTRSTNNH